MARPSLGRLTSIHTAQILCSLKVRQISLLVALNKVEVLYIGRALFLIGGHRFRYSSILDLGGKTSAGGAAEHPRCERGASQPDEKPGIEHCMYSIERIVNILSKNNVRLLYE